MMMEAEDRRAQVSQGKEEPKSFLNTMIKTLQKILPFAVVYLMGYFQLPLFFVLGAIVLLEFRRQSKDKKLIRTRTAQALALANEKDVLSVLLDDFPAWVIFPDVERAEWLNTILKQIWPNINDLAKEIIKNSVHSTLQKKVGKFGEIEFDEISLGSVPPKISGIKVHDKNINRNEIIIDVDIQYVGDCNISLKLNMIPAGVTDFKLNGTLRIIMKPLITTKPIIGGIQVFFLNNPSIDFNLTGTAELLDITGLSSYLKEMIAKFIASKMVFPKKISKTLSKNVERVELKMPEPEGVLRVHVVEAKCLTSTDIGGKSDPYAIVTVETQEYKTQVIKNSLDPKWDYWCEFIILDSTKMQLSLEVLDSNKILADDTLGSAVIDISEIPEKGQDDMWFLLKNAKKGKVHLRMTWLKLSANYEDLEKALAETRILGHKNLSTAILTVYIDSAKNLQKYVDKLDPYAIVTVTGKPKETKVIKETLNPIWEEGFTFLVNNVLLDTLNIKVYDKKSNDKLGQLTLKLSNLANAVDLQYDRQPFDLIEAGPESQIILSLQLRILKYDVPIELQELTQRSITRKPSAASCTSNESQQSQKQLQEEQPQFETDLKRVPSNVSSQGSTSAVLKPVEEDNENYSASPLPITSSNSTNGNLVHRVPSFTSPADLGRIQLTLRYSTHQHKLVVLINKISNLRFKTSSNTPECYVKLYLLPNRTKDAKRKTRVIKGNRDPVFDETLEYLISQEELSVKKLEITVCGPKQVFYGDNVIGQVVIDLSTFNLTTPLTSWYDLMPKKTN